MAPQRQPCPAQLGPERGPHTFRPAGTAGKPSVVAATDARAANDSGRVHNEALEYSPRVRAGRDWHRTNQTDGGERHGRGDLRYFRSLNKMSVIPAFLK